MQLQIKSLAAVIPVIAYFLPIGSNAFTYPLVHGNIFHLAVNTITLFMFIRATADTKTFINFIVGGYLASVLAYILCGNPLIGGASGLVLLEFMRCSLTEICIFDCLHRPFYGLFLLILQLDLSFRDLQGCCTFTLLLSGLYMELLLYV